MRTNQFILFLLGLSHIFLAAGFYFQQPWAISLWPLPGTSLSYAFIAAILAGAGAPLLWIALSYELGGLAGYGLAFSVLYAGLAASAVRLYLASPTAHLGWFAGITGLFSLWCLITFLRTSPYAHMGVHTPGLLRIALLLHSLVLLGVGAMLLWSMPDTLLWQVSPQAMPMYGWVFIGLAFYCLFAVFRPGWINAFGPLLGFLVYDIVLGVPLFTGSTNFQAGMMTRQISILIIIAFSALLALYYLFIHPSTRLVLRTPVESY